MQASTYVKVSQVRVQNRTGVIFRGQRVLDNGTLVDAHSEITVRIVGRGIAAQVMPGQWWHVAGDVASRTFINAGGFEMTEDQMTVAPGDASLRVPSGIHVVDYLARNPRFTGIGHVTAEKLWETFGSSLYSVLDDDDYQALVDVVTPNKAITLLQAWREEGLSGTLQWLQNNNFGLEISRKIVGYFGADAESKVLENPYRLLSFSAGWREVDALARTQLHVAQDDKRRLAAAVEEIVYRQFSMGDTYVPSSDLARGLRELLKGEHPSKGLIEDAISFSERAGHLQFDSDGNAHSIGAAILETTVVDCIRNRLQLRSPACDIDGIIERIDAVQGFPTNQAQRAAIHLAADHHFALITGGAGCGKTTVLKAVCAVLEEQGYELVLLALAGKAVKRMTEATGRPASTLASFIKRMQRIEDHPEQKLVQNTALVIDEASMVDLISFSSVARLVGDETKIIMVGDPDQLPPVGPGLILHCLVNIPEIPHVQLQEARRFGLGIAAASNAIKGGSLPPQASALDGYDFVECDEAQMMDMAAALYLQAPAESVVLCPTNRIVATLNQRLQHELTRHRRPVRLFNAEFEAWEHFGLNEGDLLICTKNHWDLGVTNGSLGTLIEVYEQPKSIIEDDDSGEFVSLGRIEWDDGVERELREGLLDSIELGYALTVHRSQGSQWRQVVACLPEVRGKHSSSIDRSLINTAVTRAQDQVTVMGKRSWLVKAVSAPRASDRRKVALPKRLASLHLS